MPFQVQHLLQPGQVVVRQIGPGQGQSLMRAPMAIHQGQVFQQPGQPLQQFVRPPGILHLNL